MARKRSTYDLNKLSPAGQSFIGSLHALRPASLADRPTGIPEKSKTPDELAEEKKEGHFEVSRPDAMRERASLLAAHRAAVDARGGATYMSAYSSYLKRQKQPPAPSPTRTTSTASRRSRSSR